MAIPHEISVRIADMPEVIAAMDAARAEIDRLTRELGHDDHDDYRLVSELAQQAQRFVGGPFPGQPWREGVSDEAYQRMCGIAADLNAHRANRSAACHAAE